MAKPEVVDNRAGEGRAAGLNPYVGPRSFDEAHSRYFFGRDAEKRQLTSLIIAERTVLFYAQSGAGKTSLLRASVMPELRRRRGVVVLPVTRCPAWRRHFARALPPWPMPRMNMFMNCRTPERLRTLLIDCW